MSGGVSTLQAGGAVKRLGWLLTLRWLAILGQLATIFWVHFGFKVVLPLPWLLGIVALEALSNVLAQRRDWEEPQDLIVMLMLIDLVALTGLLYFSGGPHNPFNFIYLVNVALASVVLNSRAAWGLMALSLACYAVLFVDHIALPDPSVVNPHGAHEGHAGHGGAHGAAHGGGGVDAMTLHVRGMWVGFTIAALFTTYFVTRVRRELSEAQQRIQDSERLAGLATLAAGAAHELGSPLAAIAVTAKELEYLLNQTLPGAGSPSEEGGSLPPHILEAVQEAQLIRREVDRCRSVLEQMSSQAGESLGEALELVALDELVERAAADKPWAAKVSIGERSGVHGPPRALAQALGNLCANAVDAGANSVRVAAVEGAGSITVLSVTDDGRGMDAATLARCADPFFTAGSGGGMGLGLFLARTLVERLGGTFQVRSEVGVGTVVELGLPDATEFLGRG